METLISLWDKTPGPAPTKLYEAGLVLAVFVILSDLPGGAPFGIAPEGAALLLYVLFTIPGQAQRAALHVVTGGVSSALLPVVLCGLAAVLLILPGLAALTVATVLPVVFFAALYWLALDGREAVVRHAPCHWSQFPEHAHEGVLYWSFWMLVYWASMLLLAMQGAPLAFLASVTIGAPLVGKLVNMTYLLKVWADDAAER